MLEQAEAVSRGGVALLLSVRKFLAITLADQFEQLPKAVRGANLIIGAGVQAAAASTAEAYGLRYRYVIYCPTLLPSAEHPPTFFPLPHSRPWLNRRLWSLARIGFNRGMRPALNRHRSAMGLPPVSDPLDHLLSARPVVAERAQALGRRLRKSLGEDPTVAFLPNGSAPDGSGRTSSSP
jgi:hypothetical protein